MNHKVVHVSLIAEALKIVQKMHNVCQSTDPLFAAFMNNSYYVKWLQDLWWLWLCSLESKSA